MCNGRTGRQHTQGENPMSKFFAVVALAGATIASTMIATTDQANAQFRRWGPAIGLGVAGFVAGAAIASSTVYAGPVRCGWVAQYDRWGNYMGRVKVCTHY
jgi:hypothetical protein